MTRDDRKISSAILFIFVVWKSDVRMNRRHIKEWASNNVNGPDWRIYSITLCAGRIWTDLQAERLLIG